MTDFEDKEYSEIVRYVKAIRILPYDMKVYLFEEFAKAISDVHDQKAYHFRTKFKTVSKGELTDVTPLVNDVKIKCICDEKTHIEIIINENEEGVCDKFIKHLTENSNNIEITIETRDRQFKNDILTQTFNVKLDAWETYLCITAKEIMKYKFYFSTIKE